MNMYGGQRAWVLAFHGCDKSVGEDVLAGRRSLTASHNSYDWLGSGVYFWENDAQRAQEYATWLSARTKHPAIKNPFVMGAIIENGYCLDLLRREHIDELKNAYEKLRTASERRGISLPKNKVKSPGGATLLRHLDCAVINWIHSTNEESGKRPYDSVRAAFWEGEELYPGAGFHAQSHVQICVRNPNCIKGYFRPLRRIPAYPMPGG